MIIIVGYSHAKDVEDRDATVAGFEAMVARARTQDGCVDFAITADSVDTTRSNILEIWRDEEAWKAWRKIARGPRPRTIEHQVSLYRSDKVEKLSFLKKEASSTVKPRTLSFTSGTYLLGQCV
ncbi:MAG TPA: antibiotic biosynthesis monooxygenase family protein [Tianweitania sediminis]|nr:antibiotic biosynthesis monooxygenase family protein [Tianweitania sediminis]